MDADSSNKGILQQLMHEDQEDDVIIANAERRKLIRQHCRANLVGRSHDNIFRPVVDFEFILKYYKTELRTQGCKALHCPACGSFPDDPRLAMCAHVYCEECHSNLLFDLKVEVGDPDGFVPCESDQCYGNIATSIVLDEEKWNALVQAQRVQLQSAANDVLHRGLAEHKPDVSFHHLDTNHTRCSPELGHTTLIDDTMYHTEDLVDPEGTRDDMSADGYGNQDLYEDGFDDLENRSDGYETESRSDTTNRLGEVADDDSDREIERDGISDHWHESDSAEDASDGNNDHHDVSDVDSHVIPSAELRALFDDCEDFQGIWLLDPIVESRTFNKDDSSNFQMER